jgi:ATP-dependent DNA ligase
MKRLFDRHLDCHGTATPSGIYAFDLRAVDSEDLRKQAMLERKRQLRTIMPAH